MLISSRQVDRRAQQPVLDRLDPGVETRFVVPRQDRHFLAQDDRAGIDRFGHVVNGGAGDRQPPGQRVTHGPRAAQRRDFAMAR